jgi:hypothetical protein
MFCSQCNAVLPEGSKFCLKCGKQQPGQSQGSFHVKQTAGSSSDRTPQAGNQTGERSVENNNLTAEIGTYLTQTGPYFGPWPEEKEVCRRLASSGSLIVIPTIRIVLSKMRFFGRSVDNPLAGEVSQQGIAVAFQRGTDLISEIIESSDKVKQNAASIAVSNALIQGLEDKDPLMRALTAIFCGLPVVNQDAIQSHLLHVVLTDGNDLVKYAVAVPLERVTGMRKQSRALISNLAQKMLSPELAEGMKRTARKGDEETVADINRDLVIKYLVGVIALTP